MELWDAYDREMNLIPNLVLERGPVPKDIYHIVCEIAVKHIDGTYLIMQRDFRKHLGGLWELTAGGSAFKGETPFECAKRELFEETGIAPNELKEVGKVICEEHNSIYFEYSCLTDCVKDSIKLQEGETINYKWVSMSELQELTSDELATTRIQKFLVELNFQH